MRLAAAAEGNAGFSSSLGSLLLAVTPAYHAQVHGTDCKGIIQPHFICQGAPGQVQSEETLEHCCCGWVLFAVRGMWTWVLSGLGSGMTLPRSSFGSVRAHGAVCWMLSRGCWAMAGTGVTG